MLADVISESKVNLETVKLESCGLVGESFDALSSISGYGIQCRDDRVVLKKVCFPEEEKNNKSTVGEKYGCGSLQFHGVSIRSNNVSSVLHGLASEKRGADNGVNPARVISFVDCSVDSDSEFNEIMEAVLRFKEVYVLSFKDCELKPKNVESLCRVIGSKDMVVKALNLSGTYMESDSLIKLGRAYKTASKESVYLNVSGCNLSGRTEALQSLLCKGGALKAIVMNGCALCDDDAKQIRRIVQKNNTIEYVCVDGNDIGDKGSEVFGKMLLDSSSLKKLSLNSNLVSEKGLRFLESVNGCYASDRSKEIQYERNISLLDSGGDDEKGVKDLKAIVEYLKDLKQSGDVDVNFEISQYEVKKRLKSKSVIYFVRNFERIFISEVLAVQSFNTGLLAGDRHHTVWADVCYSFSEMLPVVGNSLLAVLADMGASWYEGKIIKDNERFGAAIGDQTDLYTAVRQVAGILGVLNSERFELDRIESERRAVEPEKPGRSVKEQIFRKAIKVKDAFGGGGSKDASIEMAELKAALLINYCRLGFVKDDDFADGKNEVDVYREKFSNILLDRYTPQELCEMIGATGCIDKVIRMIDQVKRSKLEKRQRRFRHR